jgi:hypothetical protein
MGAHEDAEGGAGPKLLAIAPDGRILWQVTGPYPHSPVVGTLRLYGTVGPALVSISFDGATVDTLARVGTTGVTLGARDVVYAAGTDTLYSFTRSGERRFAVPVPGAEEADRPRHLQSAPVIDAKGTLYLRTWTGVTAFRDTVGPATDAPWPTFMGNFQRTGRVVNGTCTN